METRIQVPTQQESTIVERVARVVSNVRGVKSDYANLAAELASIIPFDIFGVVLLRHDRQAVRVTVCQREAQLWATSYHQHPLSDSKLEQLLNRLSPPSPGATTKARQTEPLLIMESYPDGLDGPPARSGDALSGFHQLHSTLIVPLLIGDRLLGTLELGSTALNMYDDRRLQRLVGSVAQVLAAAIDAAQVGGSVEIQNRQRQALKDVSSALTSRVDLSTILNSIVEGIASSLNVASAILLYNQRTRELTLAAQTGMDEASLHEIVSRKVAQSELSIIGATLRRRQPCVLQDTLEDEPFPASRIFGIKLGLRSLFSYPLITGTTIYGILLVGSSEAGGFTPLKADILALFASQATIAIHNGMLLESAHQRSRFQQAIERLEWAYQQQIAHGEELSLQDELELFRQIRAASQQTFGVSLASLMRFISDHLLTSNERNLHAAVLQAAEESDNALPLVEQAAVEKTGVGAQAEAALDTVEANEDVLAPALSQDRGLMLLTQTAEEALARTGVLSELGRLLLQLQQSTGHIRDAWFAIDLNGICISMNPVAETFCGMRLGNAIVSLKEVFVELLPRIRNIDEVSAYLHSFLSPNLDNDRAPTCRFVLAAEPVQRREQSQAKAREAGTLSGSPAELELEDVELSEAAIAELEDTTLPLNSAPSDHYHLMTRYPLYNQRGDLMAYALQIHDITEQVRDEKNKSALLSAVSHDLRTPLTIIKAAVSGLLQEGVPWDEETRREILSEVDGETDRLTDLVDALVEMSRIEMGALALVKEWCDVVEIVHGVLIRLERALADYTVKTDFQPHLPLIYADHVQLGKVFYRLLENAIEHSSPGSVILVKLDTIEAEPSLPLASGSLLRAQVIDQGSGIPETERERIFKSFYSLSPLGAGLGLAICKGIVEAHMGRIWVEAAEEYGSCFIFTLPMSPYKNTLSHTRTSRNVTVDDPHQLSPEEP
ncbi:MAG TPA: ATP-binding protein [Ktedonobacteraceae bacterium]|nr:ATP-binding protein [Ktedonobacteraceae bacterium]